jgi:hypothetical protein
MDDLRDIFYVHLFQNYAPIGSHGIGADKKRIGDLSNRLSFGQTDQHFVLAIRKHLMKGLIGLGIKKSDELVGDRFRYVFFSLCLLRIKTGNFVFVFFMLFKTSNQLVPGMVISRRTRT